jgi:hypothetical protein
VKNLAQNLFRRARRQGPHVQRTATEAPSFFSTDRPTAVDLDLKVGLVALKNNCRPVELIGAGSLKLSKLRPNHI